MRLRNIIIVIALLGSVLFPLIFVHTAAAQPTPYSSGAPVERELIVPIPKGDGTFLTNNATPPGEYINTIYRWGIGLAALLALGQLVLGGVLYTLSAGSLANQEAAKERMRNSVMGLILLIAGATLLITINPKLANLKQGAIASLPPASSPPPVAGLGTFPSGAAAHEADVRLKAALFKYDCIDDAEDIVKQIYNRDPIDFLEYLNAAKKAQGDGDAYMYHCYQDGLIYALNYATKKLDQNELSLLAQEFRGFPADVEATQYLTSDPFGRSSVTVDQTFSELMTRNGVDAEWQNKLNAAKAKIDTGDISGASALVGYSMYDPSAEQETVAQILLRYAKPKLTKQQFLTLLEGLVQLPPEYYASPGSYYDAY